MKVNRKFLLGAALCGVSLLSGRCFAEDYVIALQSAGLRATPQFFASVQSTLAYGTKVEVLSSEGAWVRVKAGVNTGWIHKSAFTKAGPVMHDLGKGEAAVKDTYKDEVVTAGKGFSEARTPSSEPATEFKYDAVDEIECRQVNGPAIKKFMDEGGLKSRVLGE